MELNSYSVVRKAVGWGSKNDSQNTAVKLAQKRISYLCHIREARQSRSC